VQTSSLTARAGYSLDVLSFLLSDVRYGLGAYLGVYLLTEHGWDAAALGVVFAISSLAGVLLQAPLGALVDVIRAKRALLAGAVVVATGAALAVPLMPYLVPVVGTGVLGSIAGTVIAPALASISLGIVGVNHFARRAGRNESLFHAGNAVVNLIILALAPFVGPPILFWMMAATAIGSVLAVGAVPERAIDHAVARGLPPTVKAGIVHPSGWRTLLTSRPLLIFAGCGLLFHLANGSMLNLVAQKLALENVGQGIALTAASAIAAQAVMVPTAALAGARADAWGRKPLLLAAFLALMVRGTLYTLSSNPAWLIGVQLLDGLGAGLIGALFPVVIADVSRGSGRFNAAQGAVGTVHAMGGILSQVMSGIIVVHAGYNVAFLVLATVAGLGAALFWLTMPETRSDT
jgi:MFS family permease